MKITTSFLALFLCLVLLLAGLTSCQEQELPEYTLYFMVDDKVYYTYTTHGLEKIDLPEDPQKEDCVFDGWYVDSTTPFDAYTLIDAFIHKDLYIYASWVEPRPE